MIRPLRALVPLSFAALAVLAPQALPGRSPAAEPAVVFVEPTHEEITHLEPAPLPRAKIRAEARSARSAGAAAVGDQRLWPALDAVQDTREYLKYFTLRAVGTHIEVWVASDQDAMSKGLEFPPVTAATTIASS